jgi:hypothetical protein
MSSRYLKLLVSVVAVLGAVTVLAHAAPSRPAAGPFIDEGVHYEGQTKCSPWAKPGVVDFQRMVLASYPGTGAGSISRDCSIGGQSEHKEGRAWDWGVNVGVPSEKAAAEDLLAWLAEEDRYGNAAAMARRLGVMYAIWNKRIWFPGSGWSVYCRDRNGACRDPEDGDVRHPHTDHVHFSFTWAGAYKKTTYWNAERSYAGGAAASPDGGVWVVGRNGSVRILGSADYHGSRGEESLKNQIVAIAARPYGDGYWLLSEAGRVYSEGAAPNRGSAEEVSAVDLAPTPTGKGYWVLTRSGDMIPFGDAVKYAPTSAGAVFGDAIAVAVTPSGLGYWVLRDTGDVESFGDAQDLGDANGDVVDIASTSTGQGYWVATAHGGVRGFGDASVFGDLSAGEAKISDLVPTITGGGYWLITEKALARAFGDASTLRARPSSRFKTMSVETVLHSFGDH